MRPLRQDQKPPVTEARQGRLSATQRAYDYIRAGILSGEQEGNALIEEELSPPWLACRAPRCARRSAACRPRT